MRDLGRELQRALACNLRGEFALARGLLLRLLKQKPPRTLIPALAEGLRDAGLPERGLSLLQRRSRQAPTPREQIACADLLVRLGAEAEAAEQLRRMDLEAFPMATVVLAKAHFRMWNWAPFIEPLERALRSDRLSADQRRLVPRWLGVAHLHGGGDLERARTIFTAIRDERAGEPGSLGSIEGIQLLVQTALKGGDFALAHSHLEDLNQAVLQTEYPDGPVLARFLKAQLELRTQGPTPEAQGELTRARSDFEALGDYFRVRYCDYVLARATHSSELWRKLYFGTPYDRFRELTLPRLGKDVPQSYEWRPEPSEGSPRFVLDLGDGSSSRSAETLRAGCKELRLLAALSADFYSPPSTFDLFRRLYPGERFEPHLARNRIAQQLLHLRRWLRREKLPVEVVERRGRFRFRTAREVALLVPSPHAHDAEQGIGDSSFTRALANLQCGLSHRSFSAEEAAGLLERPYISVIRVLNRAVEEGVLERQRLGRNVRYVFKASP